MILSILLFACFSLSDSACPYASKSAGPPGSTAAPPASCRRNLQSVRDITTAWLAGDTIQSVPEAFESGTQYPYGVMACPTLPVLTTPAMDSALYDAVAAAVCKYA